MIERGARQRFPEEVYKAIEALMLDPRTSGLSAEKMHQRLVAKFKGQIPARELPSARTIRNYRTGSRPAADVWTVASSESGEAVHVLPVIDALRVEGARPVVTRKEARTIARIAEAVPNLPPLLALDLAYLYSKGHLDIHLDRLVARLAATKALEREEGREELASDIEAGDIEVEFVSRPVWGDVLGPVIERGLKRRKEKEDARG
jgi:hypothetical protein